MAIPIPNKEPKTVIQTLFRRWILIIGFPDAIQSDQGSEFTAKICKEFYSQMHIHKYATAAYTPKSNGVVERFNKVIVDTLAKHLHNSQDMWDVLVGVVVFEYNSTIQATSGIMPHLLLFGKAPKIPLEILHQREHTSSEWNDTHLPVMTKRLEIAAERIQRSHEENARRYNKLQRPHNFAVGDEVIFLKTLYSSKDVFHKKLGLPGEGPFKINWINTNGSRAIISCKAIINLNINKGLFICLSLS